MPFLWGCLGGFIAYGLAFVLPQFLSLAETGKTQVSLDREHMIGFVGLFVFYVLVGGFAAIWLDDGSTDWRQAMAYGMSGEVVVKGIGSGARRAFLALLLRSSN